MKTTQSSCEPTTFLRSLDLDSPLAAAAQILEQFSPLFAATVGLDGRPQLRPADFSFAQNDALYFMTVKSSRFYAELCKTPYIQMCLAIPGTQTLFRLSGKACFIEDEDVLDRFILEREPAFRRLGSDRKSLIAFFLLGAEAEIISPPEELGERTLRLPEPAGVLVGITLKKNTELRDRLSKILERREQEPFATADELTKCYDGALFVFAEAAKALWPRMDIRPIERAAAFETWDEREHYTGLAASLIGNAVIDKPEDLTYWLNLETLADLLSRRG